MPTKAKAITDRLDTATEKDEDKSSASVEYEALVGLNYGDRRVEEGEIVSDLPEESAGWLLKQGYVRKVGK